MKRLFIDDYRVPVDCAHYMYRRKVDCKIYHEEWEIVRTYKDFCDWITKKGVPDIISFDYDLADNFELREDSPIKNWFSMTEDRVYTGMDCAEWLVNYCMENKLKLPQYIVHSVNPYGCEIIKEFLDNQKKK